MTVVSDFCLLTNTRQFLRPIDPGIHIPLGLAQLLSDRKILTYKLESGALAKLDSNYSRS